MSALTQYFSLQENWKIFKTIIHRKQRTVFSSLHANIDQTPRWIDRNCKCLTKWDLSALGLGSCLSIGMFVLVGSIGMRTAGPAIVLSIVLAALASTFAALCHAEFGAREPNRKPFMYTYSTVGPLPAFMVGWCNLLEGLFGTASVGKALSTYIDTMSEGKMSEGLRQIVPLWHENRVIADYFDIFSFLLMLAMGSILLLGARESLAINNCVVFLNLFIMLIIVVGGAPFADYRNWEVPAKEIPDGLGDGGFIPFGFWGMVKASALCFYGFVGFESHAISGENIEHPQAQIPQVIIIIQTILTLVFGSVTIVLTMMVPYFEIDQVAAVATAFGYVNLTPLMWIMCIMVVTAILCSLFIFMFPLPRLMYAMASRGLMWKLFMKVTNRRVPYVGTIVVAVVTALLVGFVELEQLILWMCIGTLMMYTIISVNVIVIRYSSMETAQGTSGIFKQMFGRGDKTPTVTSMTVVLGCLLLFNTTCVAMALVGTFIEDTTTMYLIVLILHVFGLFLMFLIWLQPQNTLSLTFRTPLVPLIPMLSIYMNIEMMVLVDLYTCLRLGFWVLIGLILYVICVRVYGTPTASAAASKGGNKSSNKPQAVALAVGYPTMQFTGQDVRNTGPRSDVSLRRSLSGGPLNMYPAPGTSTRHQNTSPETIQNEIISASTLNEVSPTLEQSEKTQAMSPASKQVEIIVQQANAENTEDKEAKIIDLLDQVLQAEEDSYVELISLKEQDKPIDETMIPISEITISHRKSLTELSDAGSDASLGNQELSKYSVIVQIHREDLPKLSELEEALDKEDIINYNEDNQDEQITAFNESETNSRTDESGYSDTLDRNVFNDSIEDTRDIPYIPTPPPLDESFFITPYVFQKAYTIPRQNVQKPTEEQDAENKPRESIQSNNSQDDGNIVFGSNRQKKFMNKLNDLFQNKMASEDTGEEKRKRSNSTGSVAEVPISESFKRERSKLFTDLKKEIVLLHSTPNLRPVRNESKVKPEINIIVSDDSKEDTSLSREDLKSKLETLFASGGPNLLKPRLMKSNPPTPDDSYQSDLSSTESIPKIRKIEKNDTLKRQKDKFGEVLNSFRLSLNKDEV